MTYYPFDCDNHYYEASDAFTRHVPKAMQSRCVQWVEIDGRKHHLIGGKLAHVVVNPTWDPIAKPGALKEYFRGNPNNLRPADLLTEREPLPAYYIDRDARVAKLAEQGLQGVWLFPTLGVLYEDRIKHDIEAATTLVHGFNRWINEDWGFEYQNKLFAAPYMSLADLDCAVKELEWSLAEGAHTIVMRPTPAWTAHGPRSPFDEMFDPFWARVNEAGIVTVIHAGDTGYSTQGYATESNSEVDFTKAGIAKPSVKDFRTEMAAHDWLLTLALDRTFERFPNLRIASIENGSSFLASLLKKLETQTHKSIGWFREDPVELFKQHVWINPFFEDDPRKVADIMGSERLLFGSDWPHVEGMPEPLDYLAELSEFDDKAIKMIVEDNALALNRRQPV